MLGLIFPEFVMGFLSMLKSPRNCFDHEVMLNILKELMVDTSIFGWPQVRAYYKTMVNGIEQARYDWADSGQIAAVRAQHIQTVMLQSQQQSRQYSRFPPTQFARSQAGSGLQICVPFNKGECRHKSNHDNLAHGCAYCHSVCGLYFGHTEDECKRKITDSKN